MIERHRTKGSTLLLVLAMLSILFLIGAALSYTTRLEGQASANYGALTQARMAASTGLPSALPLIAAASTGLTSTLQPWYTAPVAFNKFAKSADETSAVNGNEAVMSLRNAGLPVQVDEDAKEVLGTPQALFTIVDQAGKINLNAVRSEASLERLLAAILPSGNGPGRASAIMGLQGKRKVDETTDSRKLDLRDWDETEDKQLIESLAELQYMGGNAAAALTESELRLLSSFVTVFSQNPEVFNRPDEEPLPKISLADIDAESALAALTAAFPDKDAALLMQFAANIADYADTDDLPTVLDQQGKKQTGILADPAHTIIGVEQAPLITEVYPDAVSRIVNGDDGQFLEISNPWDKPLFLSGWRVVITGGTGTTLNTTLMPGARLVITDNYDQPSEESPPEAGSLLSIFGARKDDGMRRVQVDSSLNLPDRDSKVILTDPSGKVVDVFAYGYAGTMDGRQSLQREDPRVRTARTLVATPFEAHFHGGEAGDIADYWESGNTGTLEPAQLLMISTAYAPQTNSAVNGSGYPWQLPVTVLPETDGETASGVSSNLDIRLLDLFTSSLASETTASEEVALTAKNSRSPRRTTTKPKRLSTAVGLANKLANHEQPAAERVANDGTEAEDTATSTIYAYGKLNLNTCAKIALYGLELKEKDRDVVTSQFVEKFEALRLKRLAEKKPPFYNVSDFLIEFFPKIERTDAELINSVMEQVTVGSSSFEVVAENRVPASEMATSTGKSGAEPDNKSRRAALARIRWHIAMDEAPYSLLSYTAIP